MCVGTTKHTQPTARVVPTSGRHMNRTSGLVATGRTVLDVSALQSPLSTHRQSPCHNSSETSLGNSRAMLMYIKEHQNSHVDCFRLRLDKPSKPMSQLDWTRLKLASAILVILMYIKKRQNCQVDSRQHRLSMKVQIYLHNRCAWVPQSTTHGQSRPHVWETHEPNIRLGSDWAHGTRRLRTAVAAQHPPPKPMSQLVSTRLKLASAILELC